jgi:hypothetical protein
MTYGDRKSDSREMINWHFSYKLRTMNAIGYNAKKFFTGIQLVGDVNNIHLDKKQDAFFTFGNLKLFIGYRFLNDK